MNKLSKWYGVIVFVLLVALAIFGAYYYVSPIVAHSKDLKGQIEDKQEKVRNLEERFAVVKQKIQKLKDSIAQSQKKIYSPVEELGNDANETLFFTLYNDVIEMLHANSVKIRSIDYKYNPDTDVFVKYGKDVYFVCDVNMELVSNYINLGKFIQDIYQYPYYIKINSLEVNPYQKDKKFLVSTMSLRLYAHTEPERFEENTADVPLLDGAQTTLPQ